MSAGRVPPHSLEAEESLVGAMLLSRDAIEVGLRTVAEADFYKPAHGQVFAAVGALYHRGQPVDTVTVADELRRADLLDGLGGKQALDRLMAGTPASANASHYAGVVAELASFRRAIELAGALADAGYAADGDELDRLVGSAGDRLAAPLAAVEPGLEVDELIAMPVEYRWLVPRLLERGDRVGLVGGEGAGKSTLLRMFSLCCASGLHPFTLFPFGDALRVLIVDLEVPFPKIARAMRRLRPLAGDRYGGTLWVKARPQGMNLRGRQDRRWLDALMAYHSPDLLVIGPHYKMYAGAEGSSKSSEEAAEECAAALDDLRVRHDSALLIEMHAPHGEGGDRAKWRPRGSALWLGWPEMIVSMVPTEDDRTVRLAHSARLARDREIGALWPTRLVEGREDGWPWVVPLAEMEELA